MVKQPSEGRICSPLRTGPDDERSGRAESKQVKDLPLNGRNWSTLTALVPSAVDTGGSNQRSIRFAGRGLDDNNFVFDGMAPALRGRSGSRCAWSFSCLSRSLTQMSAQLATRKRMLRRPKGDNHYTNRIS
jgi:hypothetical protein